MKFFRDFSVIISVAECKSTSYTLVSTDTAILGFTSG